MATTLPRITARVDVDTQDLLTKAAAIAGMSSINSFVLSAAIEKAKQVIEREQTLKLNQTDAMLLMEALDSPTAPNSKLKAASERYESKTQS
ncbi:type II toxin-antitoxin system TacA family antitoxin [Shewanella sp. A14]